MSEENRDPSSDPTSRIHQIFIPSTPVVDKNQCYGRFPEIKRITQALREPGKHVLLFGGRGYGKTSLSNIVSANLRDFLTVRLNCHRSLTGFTDICKEMFRKTISSINSLNPADKFVKIKQDWEKYFADTEDFFNRERLGIVDVIDFYKKIDFPLLIVMDEADLIARDSRSLGVFADMIKAFSDQLPLIKLLIIGIADNSRDFIGEHASLERCLVEVKIDRMQEQEMRDILDGGLIKVGIHATPEVRDNIILFAHGLPYYVHLLTLYAVEDALSLNYKSVVEKNFHNAVTKALENMKENFNKTLETILGRSRESYLRVLNAAMLFEEGALAEQFYLSRQSPKYEYNFDEVCFSSEDVSTQLQKRRQADQEVLGERKISRILNLFASESKGNILQRVRVGHQSSYCFTSPLFRSFLHYQLYEKTELPKPVFFVS